MILQALCNYYDRITGKDVALPGYAKVGITSCIVLNRQGEVTNILALYDMSDKHKQLRYLIVPEQPKRSGREPRAAFLCENMEFIFGIYKEKVGADYRFSASREIHETILKDVKDEGAQAVLRFFEKRIQGSCEYPGVDNSPLKEGGNIVFALSGDEGFIHDRLAVKAAWEVYRAKLTSAAPTGQCLVTGDIAPIAILHNNISGFGQDKPTLVGFNQGSFISRRKKQGENAPVSELAAFKYTTALNTLMTDKNHRYDLHGDKIVFWAERNAPDEESIVNLLFSSETQISQSTLDEVQSLRIRGMLAALYSGKSPAELKLDENIQFYLLGLASNKTRLVIRFFHQNSFGCLVERIRQHYQDISIEGLGIEYPSVYSIIRETAVRGESKNVPPLIESNLMRSIFEGIPYPNSLYQAILLRIRAEASDDARKAINKIRIGILKGYLNRIDRLNQRKEMMTMALNEAERSQGYLLGRLFALLEKAQRDALGNEINASIVDKYLNSALATPQMVFPMLLTLSKKHITKVDNYYIDNKIEEVINLFDSQGFPICLNSEEQGRFMIGYYHQRQANYTKRTGQEKNGGAL